VAGGTVGAVTAIRSAGSSGSPRTLPVARTGTSAAPAPSHQASLSPRPLPPSPPSAIDPCLIGTWHDNLFQLTNTIDGNPVQFTGRGALGTETFRADGTYISTSSGNTPITATVNGNQWSETFTGTVTEHVKTRNGTLVVVGRSHVHQSWVLLENGAVNNSGAVTLNSVPVGYTCSGNSLAEFGGSAAVQATRAG
jgi:hypothetical protein